MSSIFLSNVSPLACVQAEDVAYVIKKIRNVPCRRRCWKTNDVADHLLNHSNDRLGRCGESPCENTNFTGPVVEEELVTGMTVKAFPNPSANYFNLQVRSDRAEKIDVKVMDIHGRTMLIKTAIPGNNSFGHELVSGTYIVEVMQGDSKQVLRLTKQ